MDYSNANYCHGNDVCVKYHRAIGCECFPCIVLLFVASLASATQDIATDGMAAEQVSGTMLSKINAVQIAGVMAGFLLAVQG